LEGRRYRLPSEAQWEYACRAGTRSRYHSGDDPEQLLSAANIFDARCASWFPQWKPYALRGDDGFAFTAPAGSFAHNSLGLHDMHGNVWEWCHDWYDAEYYLRSPVDDPTGPATGSVRVRRGGSWHTWPLYARASYRNWNRPDSRYLLLGFRVAREA
jgi:formylglycine-generating enzyme required for sulfatase activity